jgi:hypothetical protein
MRQPAAALAEVVALRVASRSLLPASGLSI